MKEEEAYSILDIISESEGQSVILTRSGSICIPFELRQPECRDAEAVRLIEMFYADYVFGGEDYAPGVEKYCTEKLIRWLKDDYTHEYDGAGYAVWNFRTGCQDGPGDVSQVVSVTALGNGLYAVKFIDMGIEGTRTVRVVCEDGGLKLDSVE